MLFEWLRQAQSAGVLAPRIYCSPNKELVTAAQAMGLTVETSVFGRPLPPKWLWFLWPISKLLATWRLLGQYGRNKFVLFAPGVVQANPIYLLVARLRGQIVLCYVPMAYKSLEMGFRYATLRDVLVRPLTRCVDLWITITEQQRDILIDRWGIKAPVHVIPNRISLPDTPPPPVPPAEQSLRVLFAGRFEPNQKGLDWLLSWIRDRAAQLRTRKITFTFQGSGPFETEIRSLADELGPTTVVIKPWGDVSGSLAKADVLLLPSRFEGLPLVAIEAIYQGVAVIATDRSGLNDFLDKQAIFRFGDANGLDNTLDWVACSSARREAVLRSQKCMEPLRSTNLFNAAVADIGVALDELENERTGR